MCSKSSLTRLELGPAVESYIVHMDFPVVRNMTGPHAINQACSLACDTYIVQLVT